MALCQLNSFQALSSRVCVLGACQQYHQISALCRSLEKRPDCHTLCQMFDYILRLVLWWQAVVPPTEDSQAWPGLRPSRITNGTAAAAAPVGPSTSKSPAEPEAETLPAKAAPARPGDSTAERGAAVAQKVAGRAEGSKKKQPLAANGRSKPASNGGPDPSRVEEKHLGTF